MDLSLLAEGAVEALVPLADRRGVAVEVGGAPAPVLGSSTLLPQLVTNLVLNAIVHNLPSGGPSPCGRTRCPTPSHWSWRTPASCCRPAHRVATLIEPFQRGAERTRSDDHAGAGLGLAIVDRITQAHGGTLVLNPRTDGGLIVTVWLPHPYPVEPSA